MIVSPDLRLEKRLWRSGLENIAGMDEAGLSAAQDALRMMRDIFIIHRNALRGDYDRIP